MWAKHGITLFSCTFEFLFIILTFIHDWGCITFPLAADLFITRNGKGYLVLSAVPPYSPLDCFLHGWPMPIICLHLTLFSASSSTLNDPMSSFTTSIHPLACQFQLLLTISLHSLSPNYLACDFKYLSFSVWRLCVWPEKRHNSNSNYYCYLVAVALSTNMKCSHEQCSTFLDLSSACSLLLQQIIMSSANIIFH